MADTPKRNAPCHCGSGKKYKNCCLEKDQSTLSSNLGMIGLIVIAIFGIWLLFSNISSGGVAQDCPAGTVWSDAHNHCH
ncbi:SEC-C metal-binding domain-containing protein [Gracilimonas mengyeensis]|uniref:SEC-C motif-containing protein n=1 Tax=Gracilimonas mengyeensis TaxID=1302730 RepID=A0A521C1L2_9BACT|nr:SEC-C metal-binding domain-containing protein [Gracilimonas mengyeensis]SMO53342.1 SEC-C motif-containing protein [Gracilimonas mengyeensis]